MAKYRKIPIVIEAIKLEDNEKNSFPDWWFEARKKGTIKLIFAPGDTYFEINTLEGTMEARFGEHYIIQGVEKEIYPCRVNIFEQTYEEII